MKDKKFEVFIIISIIFISIVIYAFYLIYDKYKSNNSYTLFLSSTTILDCYKYKCNNVTDNIDDYNNKDYYTYIDNEYKGINNVYYNSNNDKLYIFDSLNNNINKDEYKRPFIYSGNVKINTLNYTKEEISLYDINLIQNKINYNISNYTYGYKISIDIDNDNNLEYIIVLSSETSYYSILSYIDNNKVYILENNKEEDYIDVPSINISYILDIYNDKKYEIVVTKTYYDNIGSCSTIYRLKRNKLKLMNECIIK